MKKSRNMNFLDRAKGSLKQIGIQQIVIIVMAILVGWLVLTSHILQPPVVRDVPTATLIFYYPP